TGGYTGGLLALTAALIIEALLVLTLQLPPTASATGTDRRETRDMTIPEVCEGLPVVPRRTTMGLTSDSFQSIRFASPHRLLEVDRLGAGPRAGCAARAARGHP